MAAGTQGTYNVIVVGGQDGSIEVLGDRGLPLGRLDAHDGTVSALALGQLAGEFVIVSAGNDMTLRIWGYVSDSIRDNSSAGLEGGGTEPKAGRGNFDGEVFHRYPAEQFLDLRAQIGLSLDSMLGVLNPPDEMAVSDLGPDLPESLFGIHDFHATDVRQQENQAGRGVNSNSANGPRWSQLTAPLLGHQDAVLAVAIGRLGRRDVIVSGGADGTVRLWDKEGNAIGQLLGHQGGVFAVDIANWDDRHVIVSAGADSEIRLWDERGRALGSPLVGHEGAVLSVSAAKLDGRDVIVTAGSDHTVRIWDAEGRQLGEPLDSIDPISSLAVLPPDSIVMATGFALAAWGLAQWSFAPST